MAFNQINIPQQQPKRDALDRIAQGLQIAQGIFQIPVSIGTLQEQSQRRDQAAEMAPIEKDLKSAQVDHTRAETAKLRAETGAKAVNAKALIPGYSLTPGMVPKEEEVNKLKGMAATATDLAGQIDLLKGSIASVGTELLPTQEKRDMALLATNIRLSIKNLAQLGQISASDAKLLDSMVPDPTAVGLYQLNPDAPRQMQNTLELLKKTLVQKVDSQAGMHGYAPLTPREKYEPKGGAAPNPAQQAMSLQDQARQELLRRKKNAGAPQGGKVGG